VELELFINRTTEKNGNDDETRKMVIGMDLEWRDPHPCALLQLAFDNDEECLLIDLLPCFNTKGEKEENEYSQQLTSCLNSYFSTSIVVGYGYR
jgi:hypothetical protein